MTRCFLPSCVKKKKTCTSGKAGYLCWNYVPTTPFCSDHQSQIMYHPLYILAIERLISSSSLVVTIVLRLSSRASTPHFSFIFYDHFCSEHRAPRHLAPNIHVLALFMLRTSSATTLGCDHSCFLIIHVTYIERHATWLRIFMFYHHLRYVHY